MRLHVTMLDREIAVAAVEHHRKLAQDHGALSRRLEGDEGLSKDHLATNDYLAAALDKLPPRTDLNIVDDIEFPTPSAARILRIALIQWVALASKRDSSAHSATLTTDFGARRSAAQKMIDQLSEQLSLPIEDIAALVARAGGKAEASRKGKETPTLGTGDRSQLSLVEDDEDEDDDAPDRDVDWEGEVDPVSVGEDDE